jgi:SAM-dependent MidA family methyltransferase
MDIDLKEEIRKQDELLVIEIQKGLIQEQKKMIEYLEDHISKITDIISDI